jgi:hypothetical protein
VAEYGVGGFLKGQGMMFPKKRWSQPDESKTMVAECPESLMQGAVDEYLALKRLKYYRIPDGFFRWIKMKAPAGIQKWFFGMFGGQPDNTVIIPLGDGLALALLLELKTQDSKGRAIGKLHGKQKWEGEEWKVCRSVDEAIKEIDKFEKIAEEYKKLLTP